MTNNPSTAATGRGLAGDLPRPEYPRPDRDRSQRWINLNGQWGFMADPEGKLSIEDLPSAEDAPQQITVPFAWETQASGVERAWLETAWYRRSVDVPPQWASERTILTFGAVQSRARVWVNGHLCADHRGGYVPFEVDITDYVEAGEPADLVVRVDAPNDKRFLIHGKQRSLPRDDYDGVSFTPSSGIWQTVWIEPRPATHVEVARLRGDSLTAIEADVRVTGPARAGATVRLTLADGTRAERLADADGRALLSLPITDPRLWSPAAPHLYEVRVEAWPTASGAQRQVDTLTATVGLRRVDRRDGLLFLNNERLYVRGVLDQGYWPSTGITAPSDAALVRDLELARASGYTLVRKHLKFEDPRWLDHADRMGMLVWAEPACPSRYSPESVDAFNIQIPQMVDRDGNHPSIVIWGLYNEEWGLDWDLPSDEDMQRDAIGAYETLAALDHSRPIVENSGWNHVRTDLVDWHCYIEDPQKWARTVQGLADGELSGFPVPLGTDWVVHKELFASKAHAVAGLPLINSEYGGGYTGFERGWQLRWQTQELRRHDRIIGYVYTELTDIEHETAGLFNDDRSRKDLFGVRPSDVNADTVVIFDIVPLQAGTDVVVSDGPLEVPVRVSHHGTHGVRGTIRAGWAAQGHPMETLPAASIAAGEVTVQPFEVSDATVLTVTRPVGRQAARLVVWLDVDGEDAARGFLDVGYLDAVTGRTRLERS